MAACRREVMLSPDAIGGLGGRAPCHTDVKGVRVPREIHGGIGVGAPLVPACDVS